MTIRRRLVIWVVLLFAAVLLIAGGASILVLRDGLLDDIDAQLVERASIVSGVSFDATNLPRPNELDFESFPLPFLFLSEADMAIVFTDPSGQVEASIPSGRSDAPDPPPDISGLVPSSPDALSGSVQEIEAVGGEGPTYRAIAVEIEDLGAVVVFAIPIDDVQDTVRTLTLILVVAGIFAVSIMGALVWWVVRRGLRPIDDMIGAAGRIAEGDLSHRVPVASSNTEVGQLSDALNTMLTQKHI